MDWLNYHHLQYFWVVAKEGGVRQAAEQLHVSQPSISAQINLLEESLGTPLFRRSGRRLVLTDTGQVVFRYAADIFGLGRELLNAVNQRPGPRPIRFHIGITDTVPKPIATAILQPVWRLPQPVRVVCRETSLTALLPDLAAHRLDLVVADEPAQCSLPYKTYNHHLGSCGITYCAAPKLAATLRRQFPHSLHGAPALLPAENTATRMVVEKWLRGLGIQPLPMGEFEDFALMNALAADGLGFVPIPTVAAAEARRRYGLQPIATVAECAIHFYAITAERKLKHPAIVAITETARYKLFGGD